MHAIAIPPLRLAAAPELAGYPALVLTSTCGPALLVGEAAAGKVGNRAMRIAARLGLPAMLQCKA